MKAPKLGWICSEGHPYPPEVVFAAQRLMEEALGLLSDMDPLDWPRSSEAAEKLLRTCATTYALVSP